MKYLTTLAFVSLLTSPVAWSDDLDPHEVVELLEQGVIQDPRDLNRVALDLHPEGHVTETELEKSRDAYVYKVELKDSEGVEWDVELDAFSGEVLKNRQDVDD